MLQKEIELIFPTLTMYIHCQCWTNDNYIIPEFEIQFLHICHGSNGDNIYTIVHIRFIQKMHVIVN